MTALRIDVSDLLAHAAGRRELEVAAPLTGLAGSAARVDDEEPVALDLVLERISDGIVVRGTLGTTWQAECSTCLAPIEQPLSLTVDELFESDPVEGETYPITGHHIDLEQLVRDTVMLELPLAPVCADTGAPACTPAAEDADVPEPDPRWAALSQLVLSESDEAEAATEASEGERRELASERVSAGRVSRPATSEREK